MHKSQVTSTRRPRREVVGVALPEGMPIASGSAGLFRARPNYLPVTVLFRDYDLLWIRGGRGRFELGGGVNLTARVDDFVLLPPYTPIAVHEEVHPFTHHFCHMTFRPPPDLSPTHPLRADFAGPGAQALMPLLFNAKQAPGVKRAYAAMAKTMTTRDARPWRMQRALLEVMAQCVAFAQGRSHRGARVRLLKPPRPSDGRVAAIRQRIDDDPTQPWRVSDLADDVNLTAGHLHALCRKHLGMSLKRYIIDARLRLALRLLKTPSETGLPSILEVSEACGFSSQHFFSRQFKGRLGLTPMQYRNGAAIES